MPEVMPIWSAIVFAFMAIVFGIGYYQMGQREPLGGSASWPVNGPVLERWGAYMGIVLGMGLSIKNGLKGWANIHLGDERLWNDRFWYVAFVVMYFALIAILVSLLRQRPSEKLDADPFPRAYALLWFVLIVQNIVALLVTFSPSNWVEIAFCIYYLLLFVISGAVVYHYHIVKKYDVERRQSTSTPPNEADRIHA
jgi:hypothetical protein